MAGRRPVNQDAVLIADLPHGGELVAVADGMGGHAAGEVASRRALEVLQEALAGGAELQDGVLAANVALFDEASIHAEHHGMGSTVVALVRNGTSYVVANVGDSRAYRIDGDGVLQLTQDHSFVAEAVKSGQLTVEEAEKSRWRNAVTRALGTERAVQVDCFGPFDAIAAHTVLLCTDGLYRVLGEADLQELSLRTADPSSAAEALAAAAYDAGADDNISVAVIRFGQQTPGSGSKSRAAPYAAIAPDAPARIVTAGAPSAREGMVRRVEGFGQVLLVDSPRPRSRHDRRPAGRRRKRIAMIVGLAIAAAAGAYALRQLL